MQEGASSHDAKDVAMAEDGMEDYIKIIERSENNSEVGLPNYFFWGSSVICGTSSGWPSMMPGCW